MHMAMELETVGCDLCGETDTTLITHSTDHEHGVTGAFKVVRCPTCGLHYLNPRPSPRAIGQCYPNHYYAYTTTASHVTSASNLKARIKHTIRSNQVLSTVAKQISPLRHLAADSAIADDIPEWIKPGKVLDVGCGAGAFLDSMRKNGWNTVGIEPSDAAANAARAKGHTVFCQSATAPIVPELSTQQFDVILMSHSLEHVHSPTQALANLHPLLRPGLGHLIIEVPNVESLLTYWFGELGLAFDTPRHLYMYSPETLRRLIEKTGFEVRFMRHIARPVQFVRCLRLLSNRSTPSAWQSKAEATLMDGDLLRALEPLAKLASNKGLGGAIRAVATRK
jgi:2-polyprenyl-3-methyl-5-hydroxy-6-metoxy-1,4-benzoquinol methylase